MGILWFGSTWERDVDDNRFDLIDIDLFRNFRFKTLFNYLVLWVLLLLQIVLYGVDGYTCIKLLAFNEWASQIKPFLSFKIAKWLFAGCIIASIVMLIYDAIKGIKVFASKNISLTYSNSFARNLRSITSYNSYCVLNEINPSSGLDKLAFFTYFQITDCKKLLVADSPRQVINALTLYSALHVKTGFLSAIKEISTSNESEAVILYSMTLSLFIWLFFISEFLVAIVFAIPIYYNVLHVRKYQTLRQYVCIRVNNTVKKLAKGHQKKNLEKLAKENMEKNFYPRLPDIDPEMEPLSPQDFHPKPFHLTSNSTFDEKHTINVLTQTSTYDSEKNPFSDSNQFRRPRPGNFIPLKKPAQIYPSTTSLGQDHFAADAAAASTDSLVFEYPVSDETSYPDKFDSHPNLLHKQSTSTLSNPERFDSTAELLHNQSLSTLTYPERTDSFPEIPDIFPERFDSIPQRADFIPDPTHSTSSQFRMNSKSEKTPTLPYEQTSFAERTWRDEVMGTRVDPFEILTDDEDEIDEVNDLPRYSPFFNHQESYEQRMKRVRNSLKVRVREMEEEDYTRFKPFTALDPEGDKKEKRKEEGKR